MPQCSECRWYDPDADIHPWFGGGCTKYDTKWGSWHKPEHRVCGDFEPKEEKQNEQ